MIGPKNEGSKKKMVQFQSKWTNKIGTHKELGSILNEMNQKTMEVQKSWSNPEVNEPKNQGSTKEVGSILK